VKLYKESMPLYAYAGVEEQLLGMTEPQVRLPSGGYLVIHPTEALISIDVNSGRSTTERNVEETALKTNMEAAYEVGRQLRLRDLAGLIVIDFIDMGYGKNRKQVERVMKDSLKADRAKIQIGRIGTFGLMELSRQRLRPSISEAMGVMCPHCRGTGYIHSVETVGIQIIRALEKEAATGEYVGLKVTTHPEAALYLLNEKRGALQAIEQRYNISVSILMDASIITGNHRLIKVTTDGKEILHEAAKAGETRRGTRGGARRGRRGGRDGQSGGVNFDNAVAPGNPEDDAYEPQDDDDEIISGEPVGDNAEFTRREPRGDRGDRPRRDRGDRGGRDRNRNRNRGDRPDRTPRDPAQIAEASSEGSLRPTPPPVELDENGQPKERADRNRRRGRRGGRNRTRGDRPRREEGSIGNPVTAGSDGSNASTEQSSGESNYQRPRVTYEAPATSYSAPQVSEQVRPAFVVQLSEKQTNPAAVASPIISQSSGNGEDKTKRKGWWSRVLES
ncbi:MAG: ribonuclease E/G, partial [Rickettsiales bacterium]